MEIQEIYCDESGFTGNDMFHSATPYFSYAAVATSNEKAFEFCKEIRKKYKIQSPELKFGKLRQRSRGRQAITEILQEFRGSEKVAIHHKKYNLAGKMFEYIFEPVISEKSSIFYEVGLHKFVSNQLYILFSAGQEGAENLFEKFQSAMRRKDLSDFSFFSDLANNSEGQEFYKLLELFVIENQAAIANELESLKNNGNGKWILELSNTSLFGLLSEWSIQFHEMKVFCDSSKPLRENCSVFDSMVCNPDEDFYLQREWGKQKVGFNLSESLIFGSSHEYAGIQVADIFAGTINHLFKEAGSPGSQEASDDLVVWSELVSECLVSSWSVLPDSQFCEMDEHQSRFNALLLKEILQRSSNKQLILEGIEERMRELLYESM